MELFVRKPKNESKYKEFVNTINKKLNLHTLRYFTINKIVNLYDIKYENEYLVYRFSLLREWIIKNEIFTKSYVNELERIINILLIREELTGYELDYLNFYNDIVFSKNRNLKNLLVDFQLKKNEEVYFKFNYSIFGQSKDLYEVNVIFEKDEVFISNQRIIVTENNKYISLHYEDIETINLKNSYIQISTKSNLKFLIFSDNIHAFYVSLERILSLNKIRI